MSVRKRAWVTRNGEPRESWIVDFSDAGKRRRLKTFRTKSDADRFHGLTKVIGSGQIPEPLTNGYRPLEFTSPLPEGWRKTQRDARKETREIIASALRAAHPTLDPTIESVIIHVIVEMSPRSVIADVDNLLKPVLDALKGIAWVDDTQVCEMLVRRIPGRHRQLRIKIWHMPGPVFIDHLNVLAQTGHLATATRPHFT
jgi:Holliday junction resolvase RusA-like endonuclease